MCNVQRDQARRESIIMNKRKGGFEAWRLLIMIPAILMGLFGTLFLEGTNRGTPSRIVLGSAGCEFVRTAGAAIDDPERGGRCVVKGFVRNKLFSSNIMIEPGNGLRLDIGESQIVGRVEDDSFEAPLGPLQIRNLWIGSALLAVMFMLFAVAIWWPETVQQMTIRHMERPMIAILRRLANRLIEGNVPPAASPTKGYSPCFPRVLCVAYPRIPPSWMKT